MRLLVASFWVALGGSVGSLLRFWLAEAMNYWLPTRFPWPTLLANVSGCFAIGLVATLIGPSGRLGAQPMLQQLLMVGLCGGYTTFSAFSLQTLLLLQGGDWALAMLNILGSVALCLLAVWLGHQLAASLAPG
jgi:CrcB protein